METTLLTIYILMWPVLALGVLILILTAAARETRGANLDDAV